MVVGVHVSVLGLYLPPVFVSNHSHQCRPRQSSHCRSTLLCEYIVQRARWVLVAIQVSVLGCIYRLCLAGQSFDLLRPRRSFRCQPTLPCEFGNGRVGGTCGCPAISCRVGFSSPIFGAVLGPASQTIISLPVHTAV